MTEVGICRGSMRRVDRVLVVRMTKRMFKDVPLTRRFVDTNCHVVVHLLSWFVALETWINAVTGFVQGVMFRKSTLQQAHDLQLRGWVHNEPDGSVSGEAAGPTEHVQKLCVAID